MSGTGQRQHERLLNENLFKEKEMRIGLQATSRVLSAIPKLAGQMRKELGI